MGRGKQGGSDDWASEAWGGGDSERRQSGKRASKSRDGGVLGDLVQAAHGAGLVRREVSKPPVVALYVHGSVFGSTAGLLVGVNVITMAFTKHKFPWSLYVLCAWGALLAMQFGITWGVFKGTGEDTRELEQMLNSVVGWLTWLAERGSEAVSKGTNPFPPGSRLGQVWSYLVTEPV
jgi:hypothetical protein